MCYSRLRRADELGRSFRGSMARRAWIRTLGMVSLLCPVVFAVLPAQSGFHPRWEIPGFDFRTDGGWRVKARQVSLLRHQMLGQGKVGLLNSLTIEQSPTTAVSGTLLVPAVFFAYANTDSALFMTDTAQYTSALFSSSPPGGNPYTLRTIYEQMSNNAFRLMRSALATCALGRGAVGEAATGRGRSR